MAIWKRVKAIVEMPVRGDYSERDFKYDVQECIDRYLKVQRAGTEFGKPLVKGFAMAQSKLKPTKFRTLRAR